MEKALDGVPEQEIIQPPGVVSAKIDPETGKLAALGQQNAIFEYFRDDNVPSEISQKPTDFGKLYNSNESEEPSTRSESFNQENLDQEQLDQLINSIQDTPQEESSSEDKEQQEPEPESIF